MSVFDAKRTPVYGVVEGLYELFKQKPHKAPPHGRPAHEATEPVAEVYQNRVVEGSGLPLGLMLALFRLSSSFTSFDLPLGISSGSLSSLAVFRLRESLPGRGHGKKRFKTGAGGCVLPSHKKNLEKNIPDSKLGSYFLLIYCGLELGDGGIHIHVLINSYYRCTQTPI